MKVLVSPAYNDYASYFGEAAQFLQDYSWVYNFAVTQLLVHNVLEQIPPDWASVLLALTNEELNAFSQGSVQDDWPASLISFCHCCQRLRVPHKIATQNPVDIPHNISRGLTPKKQHEVTNLTELIHKECSAEGITRVLDMGSGLGYLDQLLHHRHGYYVTGFESEAHHVQTATERQQNLGPTQAVKHVTCNISPDALPLIRTHCRGDSCIVGLHTCGDLTVDIINLFLQLESTNLMIVVPCCYHKMALVAENKFANFPLSSTLSDVLNNKFCEWEGFLTRPFMRLASQETVSRWKNMSEEKHKEHSENLMMRAVLQLAVHKEGLVLKKKNRRAIRKTRRMEFNSFMEDALSRFEFETENLASIRQQMTELWDRHKEACALAEVFTALQMCVQSVAESFVQVDRVAYLQEQGMASVEIVKVMDDALSPRCCALIARKR